MKYTKKYLIKNNIAIKCKNQKEQNKLIKYMQNIGVKTVDIDNFDKIYCIFNLEEKNLGIELWRGDKFHYTKMHNYTIITAEEFLNDVEGEVVYGTDFSDDTLTIIKSKLKDGKIYMEASDSLDIKNELEKFRPEYIEEDVEILKGNEAKRYRIQKEIEKINLQYVGCERITDKDFFEYKKMIESSFEYTYDFVEEIIKKFKSMDNESLRLFFGISEPETMTKREAIIKNKSFNYNGKEFICKGMYEGDDAKVYFENGNFVKNSWFYDDEDETVTIIKD